MNTDQRFPVVCVVPVTGTPGEGALYPELSAGSSGLAKTSYALVDHIRAVGGGQHPHRASVLRPEEMLRRVERSFLARPCRRGGDWSIQTG